jgi:hypothetical protein
MRAPQEEPEGFQPHWMDPPDSMTLDDCEPQSIQPQSP